MCVADVRQVQYALLQGSGVMKHELYTLDWAYGIGGEHLPLKGGGWLWLD